MLSALSCIKLLELKKSLVLLLILIGNAVYAQDSTLKGSGIIYKAWPGYNMNGQMLKEKELKTELYKVPSAIPYYQKSKTSKTVGLSLIPPAVLFALLYGPNDGINNNRTGYAVASIAASGTSIFFLLQSNKFKKKSISIHNKNFR